MSSELLATYAGLGTHDGEHYYKGEECLGECTSLGSFGSQHARNNVVHLWIATIVT